jgi:hypothetical protein
MMMGCGDEAMVAIKQLLIIKYCPHDTFKIDERPGPL